MSNDQTGGYHTGGGDRNINLDPPPRRRINPNAVLLGIALGVAFGIPAGLAIANWLGWI